MLVVTKSTAEAILRYLLYKYNFEEDEGTCFEFSVAGYFKEGDCFTCFDNTNYCCFVEQAKTEKQARQWCLHEIEAAELYFDF